MSNPNEFYETPRWEINPWQALGLRFGPWRRIDDVFGSIQELSDRQIDKVFGIEKDPEIIQKVQEMIEREIDEKGEVGIATDDPQFLLDAIKGLEADLSNPHGKQYKLALIQLSNYSFIIRPI